MQNKFIAYAALMGFALTAVAAEDGFYGDSPKDSAKIVEPKKGKESEQSVKQGDAKVKKDGGPALFITGYGTANVHTSKQSKGARHQGYGKNDNLAAGIDESTLVLNYKGETARFGGLDWGGRISLAVDNYNQGNPFKDAYLNAGNMDKWGMFYIGNVKGVEYRMVNHAKDTQTAIGGAFDNSDVQDALIAVASGVEHLQTELSYGSSRAVKLMWMSPKVSGFQVGISHTPNTKAVAYGGMRSSYPTASATKTYDSVNPGHSNMYKGLTAFGLNWEKKLKSGMKVMLGGVFMTGATRVYYAKKDTYGTAAAPRAEYNPGLINRHAVRAYTLAAGIEYKGVEAALQYLNNGKSGQAKDFRGRKGQTGYAAGIGYNWGVNKVGFGYQHIVRKLGQAPRYYQAAAGDLTTGSNTFGAVGFGKSRADSYGVQYQHVITEGLAALAEYAHVRSTTSVENYRLAQYQDMTTAVKKNSGHGFLVGLGFYF